ncbi:unnamed protein product [Linum tenue]|uniref:Uncharacterized protein n=1 Tax=Linum tenue TaxID=586396 RepID=A0AAV0PIF9_9ROSI|nr:unnamed protein product [Linum tenue]
MDPIGIKPWELKSLPLLLTTMSPSNSPFHLTPESISRLSTDYPLFSFTISLCVLIVLYFPRAIGFCLSPVIVITALSLLCLIRLGTVQRAEKSKKSSNPGARS